MILVKTKKKIGLVGPELKRGVEKDNNPKMGIVVEGTRLPWKW